MSSRFQLKTLDGVVLEFRRTWRKFVVGRGKEVTFCTIEFGDQDHYALCIDVQRDAQMLLRELETKGATRGWISLLCRIICYRDLCTLQGHIVRTEDVKELLKWMLG